MEVQKQGILVISRHAESEWNLLGKWTGWTDVNLTEKGMREAEQLGEIIRDIHFDAAYTSELKRTQQTCDGILRGKGDQEDLERIIAKPLNERDYGDLTGKNKWEAVRHFREFAASGIIQYQVARHSKMFMRGQFHIFKAKSCRGCKEAKISCLFRTVTLSVH